MDQQSIHWLYGLSAPMVALNSYYGASYTAANFYTDNETVDLADSWGISNRDDLLEMIARMTDDGHADALAEGYFLRNRMQPAEWQDYVDQQNDYNQALLSFVAQTSTLCGSGGIRAWDIGRMSFLARIGVLNQFINEQESLWIHSRLALRAFHYYASWEQYCAGYVFGRVYWQCRDMSSPELLRCAISRAGESNTSVMYELAYNEHSPVKSLPWYVDIEDMDKPESLQGVDWS